MVALRVVGEAGGTVTFLIALAHLPIASVSAVLQALPLAVTMGAALVFNEGVGWRRWLAIAIGFAGVLVIVRPGFEGFSVYSLVALACVACCAVRDLATKRIPKAIPTLLVSTATALAMTILGAALLSPMGGWTPMTGNSTALLALAACSGAHRLPVHHHGDAGGRHLLHRAIPLHRPDLVDPACLFVFADVPDLPMIVGATIIIGSGLYERSTASECRPAEDRCRKHRTNHGPGWNSAGSCDFRRLAYRLDGMKRDVAGIIFWPAASQDEWAVATKLVAAWRRLCPDQVVSRFGPQIDRLALSANGDPSRFSPLWTAGACRHGGTALAGPLAGI